MDFIDFPAFLVTLETQTYFSKTLTMSDLTIFLSESFLIMILAKFFDSLDFRRLIRRGGG